MGVRMADAIAMERKKAAFEKEHLSAVQHAGKSAGGRRYSTNINARLANRGSSQPQPPPYTPATYDEVTATMPTKRASTASSSSSHGTATTAAPAGAGSYSRSSSTSSSRPPAPLPTEAHAQRAPPSSRGSSMQSRPLPAPPAHSSHDDDDDDGDVMSNDALHSLPKGGFMDNPAFSQQGGASSYGFEDLEEVDDEEAVFELNDS